jgi:hypothetical protein
MPGAGTKNYTVMRHVFDILCAVLNAEKRELKLKQRTDTVDIGALAR